MNGFLSFLLSLFLPTVPASTPATSSPAGTMPATAAKPGFILPADALAIVRRINAGEFGNWFNAADVMAIIEIESHFQLATYKAEPQIKDASRGLMQLLLSSAEDRGYIGGASGLYDAETNIRYGMKHLKWSWDFLTTRLGKRPTRDQWIASYNEGVGNVLKGRTDLPYINKFNAARKHYA